MELQGKAALVTGGSRGVGAATALKLAQGGCRVAINYHQAADSAEAVASQCREAGGETIVVQGDVADDTVCRAMVAATMEAFGGMDILINNAGTTRFIDFPDLEAVTDEVWERIFAVNLKGPFQCARAAREALAAGDGGVIVNTASVAGIAGAGSCIPYAASKAALINMTIALARTLGPTIRVNAVAPGFIEGDWLRQGLGEAYESAKVTKADESLLDAVSTPEDISQGILGLVAMDKVTGHTLVMDAGHTAGPRLTHGIK